MSQQLTINQAVTAWLSDAPHLAPSTVVGYESVGRRLARSIDPSLPLCRLRVKDVQAFLAAERGKVGRSTYNYDLRVLKVFLSWARRAGHLPDRDFLAGTRPLPAPRQRPRTLNRSEEALLESQASSSLRELIVLAIETGLRRRALLSLQWSHVDLERGTLDLPPKLLKSGRALRVPLSQRAWQALRALKAVAEPSQSLVNPMTPSQLRREWAEAVRICGLSGFRWHDLRKTFVTRCCQRGVRLEVCMALSDHTDVSTVLRIYREVSEEELLSAVNRGPAVWTVPGSTTTLQTQEEHR